MNGSTMLDCDCHGKIPQVVADAEFTAPRHGRGSRSCPLTPRRSSRVS